MASVRDRKVRIVQRGLRLLQECKVPRFSATDAVELNQLQHAWSGQVVSLLTRLLRFLERHRETLFEQDWGPVTREFRKHFVLVYFEQVAMQFERAEYQPEEENVYDLELRLSKFEEEVDCILTKESNSVLRNWLFHHYGCVLGSEGWQNQPGEVYSFVRLSCFLVDSERTVNVHLGSRALSFAETFGLRLLADRQNGVYQMLGIRLVNAVMRHTCENDGYTSNAEDILELTLRLVQKLFEENDDDLFNIVYYSVRSVRVPNRSLDDEVMRTLVYLLSDEDSNVETDATYMRTLIRILLLEVPEVQMDERDCDKFTIYGRASNGDKLRSHLMERFQRSGAPLDTRIPTRWKLRIGQLLPKLLGRIVSSYADSYYTERNCVQGLGVLMWLVLFPVGHTWRQKSARSAMFCGMLDGMFTGLNELLQTLRNQTNGHNAFASQTLLFLHLDLVTLSLAISDGFNVLVGKCLDLKLPCPVRHLLRIRDMTNSLTLRTTGVHRLHQQIIDALVRLFRPGSMSD